jgi:transposase
MTSPEDMASLSREELLALVAQLQSKRQATPFSKGTRTKHPTRPGRQPGEGTFSFRQAPCPEAITEPPVNVPVTLESCPTCGGELSEQRVDFAYITDLSPLPQPRVTQYRVWVCQCTGCGRRVRGQHPELAPAQYGATAHRVGQRAMAVAHTLHYQFGIPVRKVPGVLARPKLNGNEI